MLLICSGLTTHYIGAESFRSSPGKLGLGISTSTSTGSRALKEGGRERGLHVQKDWGRRFEWLME